MLPSGMYISFRDILLMASVDPKNPLLKQDYLFAHKKGDWSWMFPL